MTIVTSDNPRLIRCESNLEAKAAYVLLARPDVVDVSEQPEAVAYLDEDGCQRHHTFDFLVTRVDGTRIAVAVKPAKVARRRNLHAMLGRVAAQMSRAFADAVLLLTDEDLPAHLVQNAMLVHAARRGRCAEHDGRVAEFVRSLNGRITVGTLVEALGLAGDGFRAVVRAIGDGLLDLVGGGCIDYDTLVSPVGGIG